jgi:hypothetical protein
MMRTRATTSSSVGGFQPVVRVVSLISGGVDTQVTEGGSSGSPIFDSQKRWVKTARC